MTLEIQRDGIEKHAVYRPTCRIAAPRLFYRGLTNRLVTLWSDNCFCTVELTQFGLDVDGCNDLFRWFRCQQGALAMFTPHWAAAHCSQEWDNETSWTTLVAQLKMWPQHNLLSVLSTFMVSQNGVTQCRLSKLNVMLKFNTLIICMSMLEETMMQNILTTFWNI